MTDDASDDVTDDASDCGDDFERGMTFESDTSVSSDDSCDDPRHTSRTNTPGEAPVLCYQYCHKHPRGVKCWATRTEYFDRIIAKHGRKKRGRAWA